MKIRIDGKIIEIFSVTLDDNTKKFVPCDVNERKFFGVYRKDVEQIIDEKSCELFIFILDDNTGEK